MRDGGIDAYDLLAARHRRDASDPGRHGVAVKRKKHKSVPLQPPQRTHVDPGPHVRHAPRSASLDRGNLAAPWQGGRLPTSPRTGRSVAQSTAQAEYDAGFDSVPVNTDDESHAGGFWDYEQERAMGPRRGPPVPPRYDGEEMAAFFERLGNELSARDWEVYKLFWEGRKSYAEIARRLDMRRDRVYEAIKRLRVKCVRSGPTLRPPRGAI